MRPAFDIAVLVTALTLSTLPRQGGEAVAQDTANIKQAITGNEIKCINGKARGFDCHNTDLISFLPTAAIGGASALTLMDSIHVTLTGLWGWTDSATGREFAIVGQVDRASFVEVTDPANPKYLGDLPRHEGTKPSFWRDIKVYKHYAFIVSDQAGPHGMQVFDLTQLRDVKNTPAIFKETAHYDNIASAHTMFLNQETGYAYPVGVNMGGETCGGGLHMVDVRTPTKPTFAGCFTEPRIGGLNGNGYVHETLCTIYRGPDQQHKGREICFNSSGGALGIADVTDRQQPKTIGIATYPNTGYAHQGWLTEDQRYFFLGDELDDGAGGVDKTRTIVFDLADLDDPVVLTEFYGTTPASDHNLYIRGRYMYQSNFRAGLRVIDVADPKNPREVGYFDTYPDRGENKPGFSGSWSNYAYFKNADVIAVMSVNEGLFMVRFRQKAETR